MKDVRAIIPANPGWTAGFVSVNSQGYRFEPVAAWAHVDRPSGEVALVGIVRCETGAEPMALATDNPDFVGFAHPGEDLQVWMAKWDAFRNGPEYAAPRIHALMSGPNGRGGPAAPRKEQGRFR